MNKRDTLISLKQFSKTNFKELFSKNRGLENKFMDICQTHIDYAHSILNDNPYEALDVYKELDHFHDILGSMPHTILDLSVEIIVRIADDDVLKALEFIEIIEIDDFKVDALNKILEKTEDENIISILVEKISFFNSSKFRY